MRIALFYGTCTGKTEAVAEQIKDELGEDFFEIFEDVFQRLLGLVLGNVGLRRIARSGPVGDSLLRQFE